MTTVMIIAINNKDIDEMRTLVTDLNFYKHSVVWWAYPNTFRSKMNFEEDDYSILCDQYRKDIEDVLL